MPCYSPAGPWPVYEYLTLKGGVHNLLIGYLKKKGVSLSWSRELWIEEAILKVVENFHPI